MERIISDVEFSSRPRIHVGASLGMAIGIHATFVVALFVTGVGAADHNDAQAPAEIWHGSKLVVPSTKKLKATGDDRVANTSVPTARELPNQPSFIVERLSPALQSPPLLPLPLADEQINLTTEEEFLDATSYHVSDHDLRPQATSHSTSNGTSTLATPPISVAADLGYEISAQPHLQEVTTGSATHQTAVQPLSFHFTIEEKDTNHQPSAPHTSQASTKLATASNPSLQESRNAPIESANSSAGSAIRGPGVLLAIATFALGLLSFPLILAVCVSVYLRRTVKNGPLFRVELVNPTGGEQPYHVGLARIALSQGPDAAESAREDEPSMPAHRHGTVIDEPLPIPSIGTTYDEQKRNEEEQRRELEQAMLKQAFQQNVELRQQLATDSDA